MADLQSRYVNIKCNMSKTGLQPETVADWILHPLGDEKDEYGNDFGGWEGAQVFWAVHHEPGKEEHFHMVVRFPSVTRWGRLRDYLRNKDEHHYSQPARAFNRSVRYLLHLDNNEKIPIPRDSLKVSKNVDQSELSLILGAPRVSVLHDIRNLPALETFRAFDYLCNERGHSPNEVCQVLRCLASIDDWLKKVRKDSALAHAMASLPVEDDLREDKPFLDFESPLEVSQGLLEIERDPDVPW